MATLNADGVAASTPLVILGATGAVGRRVTQLAVDAGLRPLLAGRRRQRLEELAAPHGLEVRVGDLSAGSLDRMFAGTTVVLNGVGPYALHGPPVLEAALRAGAHYIDSTGEPRWVEKMLHEYAPHARRRGLTLMPGVGLGTIAELATRLASEGLPDVDDIALGYSITGYRPSIGSIRSALELLAGGAPVAAAGSVHFRRAGSSLRVLPGGRGALFPTPIPLLFAERWPASSISCYVEGSAAGGLGLSAAGHVLSRPRGLALARTAALRIPAGAGENAAHQGRSSVTVVVSRHSVSRVVAGEVDSVYELTARSAFLAASVLLAGAPQPGVRAPGFEMTDARLAAEQLGIRLSGSG